MVIESHKKLINNILSLPSAPILLEEINAKLKEEQTKREQFYNDITENEKAEFINGEIIIHSPVKKEHNDVTGSLYQLLNPYVKKNKLGYIRHYVQRLFSAKKARKRIVLHACARNITFFYA